MSIEDQDSPVTARIESMLLVLLPCSAQFKAPAGSAASIRMQLARIVLLLSELRACSVQGCSWLGLSGCWSELRACSVQGCKLARIVLLPSELSACSVQGCSWLGFSCCCQNWEHAQFKDAELARIVWLLVRTESMLSSRMQLARIVLLPSELRACSDQGLSHHHQNWEHIP